MEGRPSQNEGSQQGTHLGVLWKKLAGETSTSPFPECQQQQNPTQMSSWNSPQDNELQQLHSHDQRDLHMGFQSFVGPNAMASSTYMDTASAAHGQDHVFFGWNSNNMETLIDRDRQPRSSSCLSELMDIDAAAFDSSYMSFTQCLQAGLQMDEADYSALSRSLGVSRELGHGRQLIINDPELNPGEHANIEESGRHSSSAAAAAPAFHDFDPSSIMMAEEQAGGHMGDISNAPTTPNSSISSSSTEGLNEDQDLMRQGAASGASSKRPPAMTDPATTDTQDKPSPESKKPSKPRKKGQKRNREPRFAFMTKSDVDHLEDGYRWRKYGQKAVKNSPYPRSYYRCTNTKCSVKKRVERSFEDPTIVITTYEGQHTHQSPALLRGGSAADQAAHIADQTNISSQMLPAFTFPLQMMLQVPPRTNLSIDQQQQQHPPRMLNIPLHAPDHQRAIPPPPPPHSAPPPGIRTPTDHGLLEDIVPSAMRNLNSS